MLGNGTHENPENNIFWGGARDELFKSCEPSVCVLGFGGSCFMEETHIFNSPLYLRKPGEYLVKNVGLINIHEYS